MERPSRNSPCPCGSGKRYKHCHGAEGSPPGPERAAPDPAESLFLRALELHQAGKLDEAERLYRELLMADPANAQVLHYLGMIHYQRGHHDEAQRCVREALRLDDTIPMAYTNLALILRARRDTAGALEACGREIDRNPANAVAHNNRGLLLADLGRYGEALASCDRAIALQPRFAEALANRGRALQELGRHEEALASFREAIALNPRLPNVAGYRLHTAMQCCSLPEIDEACAAVLAAVDRGEPASPPFPLLAVASTPAQQQRCARNYVRSECPASPNPLWRGERYGHDRIRVAYVSADFRDHPVAHLVSGLLERHDRSKFEVFGISYGPATGDPWRRRVEKACDRFHDVHGEAPDRIAAMMRELEIDVAVDLMGHTRNARLDIFALRPSPIQVSYLGYAGTVGAGYIDYLVADRVVVPPEHQPFYDEKLAYLPHCFMANDSTKPISPRRFQRDELGLPEGAFVWCCFNNNFKITPDVFDCWMRLLREVQGSVLWLSPCSEVAAGNLRAQAAKRGIAPERLVFAPRMALLEEHLARIREADLFLDTFHYSAHTTASDALWAGLPVLTCLGGSFAGRVAASLLEAVGLPELITRTRPEYESLALGLAADPARLQALRRKLSANRQTWPLFDTDRFVRHIEAAYGLMMERHRNGLPPGPLSVPALPPMPPGGAARPLGEGPASA